MADTDAVHIAPAVPESLARRWRAVLTPLRGRSRVSLSVGWQLEWEREQWRAASAHGVEHISVRLHASEVFLGPRWVPGADSGCAGCAEVRARTATLHPLTENLAEPLTVPAPTRPLLLEVASSVVGHLADRPLRTGELYAVGGPVTSRHRVRRAFACPICGPPPVDQPGRPDRADHPAPVVLHSRPAESGNPSRGAGAGDLLDAGAWRARVVDPRFGPVLQVQREGWRPFAMSATLMPDAHANGFGRAMTFGEADAIAVLEAYERLAGFPHEAGLITDVAHRDVSDIAIDPVTLGQYTSQQLAHPTSRARAYTADTPMDWVWGSDVDDGTPCLVPAEIGFYQYDYRYRRARFEARRGYDGERVHFFPDSSSGCALGASVEEAALHSLLELAERDAFLIAWHRAAPLPRIDLGSITDPTSRRLLDFIDVHRFDVYLLVATQDIDVPVVWSLGVNRDAAFPATLSAAGSGLTAASAARAALWELGQLVTQAIMWDPAETQAMAEDPWRVLELEDHLRLYGLPQMAPRVLRALGSHAVELEEAFTGWPDRLNEAARGDVLGALRFVRDRYADAGLDRIVLVDQSTRDHRDLGIAAVKAVVPGITPMCFGHAHQRLAGLPRLRAAMVETGQADRAIPYDPHPFP